MMWHVHVVWNIWFYMILLYLLHFITQCCISQLFSVRGPACMCQISVQATIWTAQYLGFKTKTHHIHHPIMEDFGQVEVQAKIMELSQLPSTSAAAGDYGNVRYLAQQLLDVVPQESFEERVRISGCLGRLAGVWSLWAIFGLKGSRDWPKVKAFREQLEKLDEKTLDLSTAQELIPQPCWCRSGCNSNCVRSCPAL